jgi:hypothetical protein
LDTSGAERWLDTAYNHFMKTPMWLVHNFFLLLQCRWPFVWNELNVFTNRRLGRKRLLERIDVVKSHCNQTILSDALLPPLIYIICEYIVDEEETNPIQWFYEHLDNDDQRSVVLAHNTKLLAQ